MAIIVKDLEKEDLKKKMDKTFFLLKNLEKSG